LDYGEELPLRPRSRQISPPDNYVWSQYSPMQRSNFRAIFRPLAILRQCHTILGPTKIGLKRAGVDRGVGQADRRLE